MAVFVSACLAASPALAAPTAASLQAGLDGNWAGALGYRDYQTDKLSELAVETQIRAVGDGVTVLRFSKFIDGPAAGAVWITTASLFDPSAGTVTATSLRKDRAAQLSTERVSVAAYTDTEHWTVYYEQEGRDDDQPARVRVTETRDGDTLLAVKEVQPLPSTDGKWRFRNQTRLTRR